MAEHIFYLRAPDGALVRVSSYDARRQRLKDAMAAWCSVFSDGVAHWTLTYRPDRAWCASDISVVTRPLRDARIPYAWVLQLQKSGNPHYHLMVCDRDVSLDWRCGISHVTYPPSAWYLYVDSAKRYQLDFDRYPPNARLYGVSYGRASRPTCPVSPPAWVLRSLSLPHYVAVGPGCRSPPA